MRWKDMDEQPILPLDDARAIFRDIVLGLEYRKYLVFRRSVAVHMQDPRSHDFISPPSIFYSCLRQFICRALSTEISNRPICCWRRMERSRYLILGCRTLARRMDWSMTWRTHQLSTRWHRSLTRPIHSKISFDILYHTRLCSLDVTTWHLETISPIHNTNNHSCQLSNSSGAMTLSWQRQLEVPPFSHPNCAMPVRSLDLWS